MKIPNDGSLIQKIFQEIILLPPEKREAILISRCAGDEMLENEIRSLLSYATDDEEDMAGLTILDVVESKHAAFLTREMDLSGQQVGSFELIKIIGSGGMGQVYLAHQHTPGRDVAIKLLNKNFVTVKQVQRFELECEILAKLQHPAIAAVFEMGMSTIGEIEYPWIAMEYVKGALPITTYCQKNKLSNQDCIQLLIELCKAVHHGHEQGVIHRDLKPQNILVDHDGNLKVIDFGVAKCTSSYSDVTTIVTQVGGLVGTLAWMSPEQCGNNDVSIRSDIYALGLVSLEVMCGESPVLVEGLGLTDALNTIQRGPTTQIQIAKNKHGNDLGMVLQVATSENPVHRYDSANALANDLQNVIDCKPIMARKPTIIYKLHRFTQRNPLVSLMISALLTVVFVGIGLITNYAANETYLRREAVRQARVASLSAAVSSIQTNDMRSARMHLDSIPEESRAWSWNNLNHALKKSVLREDQHVYNSMQSATSEDGAWVVTVDDLGIITIQSTIDLLNLQTINFGDEDIWGVAFFPNEHRFVTSCWDGIVRVHSIEGETLAQSDSLGVELLTLDISPDGLLLAISDNEGSVHVLDSITLKQIAILNAGKDWIRGVSFDTSGEILISSGADGFIRWWKVGEWEIENAVLNLSAEATDIECTPDGTHIIASLTDGTIALISTETHQIIKQIDAHEMPVESITFSPDGTMFASTSMDELIKIWSYPELQLQETLLGHTGMVWSVVWPIDQMIVSTGEAGEVRIWNMQSTKLELPFGWKGEVLNLYQNSNESFVLVTSKGIWSKEGTIESEVLFVRSCVSQTNNLIALIDAEGTVKVYNSTTFQLLGVFETQVFNAGDIAITPDGTRIAVIDLDKAQIELFSSNGAHLYSFESINSWGGAVTFSSDGEKLVGPGDKQSVESWSVDSGLRGKQFFQDMEPPRVLPGRFSAIGYAIDGDMIIIGCQFRNIIALESETFNKLWSVEGHRGTVASILFLADERSVMTASTDGTVRVWDVETGASLLRIHVSDEPLLDLVELYDHGVIVMDRKGTIHTLRN